MKNVAVFFGGQSVEHDISVITGVMSLNSLDDNAFCGIPIYIDKNGEWYTGEVLKDLDNYKCLDYKKLLKVTLVCGDNCLYVLKKNKLKKFCALSVALNCLHGERGEDGCLYGLLSMCKIPLASPPITPSAVCMDKTFTKTVMKGLGVKTLNSITVSSLEQLEKVKKNLNYPVIVKPNKSGSSIGVNKAVDDQTLKTALLYALRFGESAIIEPCLENFIEINCACYQDSGGNVVVSECERPVGRNEVLTFGDKYKSGKRIFPADIDKKYSDKIKKITQKVYCEAGFTGVIRIDYFLVDKDIILNEINTVPGSLAYYLFGNTLKTLTTILSEVINRALGDYARSLSVQTEFKSGVLTGCVGKGAKVKR
ncbi:MAG: ATP-grasp domain-containing protein [Clostridia bacterium]|nr:ATP-grasp domain-containing protein [Clostridia bacterium]